MSPLILGGRGSKGGWVLKIFGIKSRDRIDRKRLLGALIVKIDTSLSEIRSSIMRLRLRYEELMKRTMTAILRGERDRALIYANEVNEVKKMVKKLKVSEKALEQVKLRLETLENVTNVPAVLGEIASVLVATRDYVRDVMPSLALSLDSLISEARRVISETTDVDVSSEEVIYATPEAKKLLKELENMAEESVSKQLPSVPVNLIAPPTAPKNASMEVTVKNLVGISSIGKPRIRKPVRRLSPEEIDRKVLEYIITHGGFIDINDAAKQLNIEKSEVLASLHRLREQNKIVF